MGVVDYSYAQRPVVRVNYGLFASIKKRVTIASYVSVAKCRDLSIDLLTSQGKVGNIARTSCVYVMMLNKAMIKQVIIANQVGITENIAFSAGMISAFAVGEIATFGNIRCDSILNYSIAIISLRIMAYVVGVPSIANTVYNYPMDRKRRYNLNLSNFKVPNLSEHLTQGQMGISKILASDVFGQVAFGCFPNIPKPASYLGINMLITCVSILTWKDHYATRGEEIFSEFVCYVAYKALGTIHALAFVSITIGSMAIVPSREIVQKEYDSKKEQLDKSIMQEKVRQVLIGEGISKNPIQITLDFLS